METLKKIIGETLYDKVLDELGGEILYIPKRNKKIDIKKLQTEGMSAKEIAKKLGVTRQYVYQVMKEEE